VTLEQAQRVAGTTADVEDAQGAAGALAEALQVRSERAQRHVVVRGVPEVRLADSSVALLAPDVFLHVPTIARAVVSAAGKKARAARGCRGDRLR